MHKYAANRALALTACRELGPVRQLAGGRLPKSGARRKRAERGSLRSKHSYQGMPSAVRDAIGSRLQAAGFLRRKLAHFNLRLGAQLLRKIRTQLLVLAFLQLDLQIGLHFFEGTLLRLGMCI